MVDFSNVPANTLVPFTWVEIAGSALIAGPSIQPYKALIIAQKLAAGTEEELIPRLTTSPEQACVEFGNGSQMHKMVAAWLKNNRVTELWVVALDDPGGATQATGTLVVTGAATAAGTLICYVGGQRFEIGVTSGDSATAVGDAIVAAIPADLIATAANVTGTVTFTAKNGGAYMNGVDIRTSYARGEEIPAGLAIAETDFAGGAGVVDVDEVWPVIPAQHFNLMAVGANDTVNAGKLDTELGDRWLPDRTLEGTAFIALDDTVGNQVSHAAAIDSKFVLSVGVENVPTAWYEVAAGSCAIAAKELSKDPARPLQTLQLSGVLAPAETDQWTLQERETLLANGIGTVVPDAAGRMRIERMTTTYLTNDQGAPDTSFRDIMTLATLSFMRYDLRVRFAAKFPRHKLAQDGTPAGAGQAIVTPSIARAFLVGMGEQWAELLILEDVDAWRDNLIVELDPQNPNRLNIRVAPDLVNQLRTTAARIEFFV